MPEQATDSPPATPVVTRNRGGRPRIEHSKPDLAAAAVACIERGFSKRQAAKLGIGKATVTRLLQRHPTGFGPVKESLTRQWAAMVSGCLDLVDPKDLQPMQRVITAGIGTDKIVQLTKSDISSAPLHLHVDANAELARLQAKLSGGPRPVIDILPAEGTTGPANVTLPPVAVPVVSADSGGAIIGVSGTSSHNQGCISQDVPLASSRGRGAQGDSGNLTRTSPVTPLKSEKGNRKSVRSAKSVAKKVVVGPPAEECY